MAQTTPPTITAAPTPPQRNVKATFSSLVDAFVTWLVTAVAQFGAVATNVYNNAVDAFNSAVAAAGSATAASTSAAAAQASADASVVASGVTAWVSGTTYAVGNVRYSPIDYRSYRRKTAGAGTADPSSDAANWVCLSVEAPLAIATVGSAVANIDFLSLFTDTYAKYIIEIEGLTPSAVDYLSLRVAYAGAVSSGSADYGTPSTDGQVIGSSNSLGLNFGTPDGTAFNFTVVIRNARSTVSPKAIGVAGVSNGRGFLREGTANIASPISGFRLYLTNGANFTAGKVRVYGVRAN